MADVANRYPENIIGKYYVDNQCIDCDLCRETAPDNFKRNDDGGYSFVYKQPENSEEETCGACHFHCSGPSREPHWRNVVLRLDQSILGGRADSMVVQVLKQRREKVNAAAERMFGRAT